MSSFEYVDIIPGETIKYEDAVILGKKLDKEREDFLSHLMEKMDPKQAHQLRMYIDKIDAATRPRPRMKDLFA